MINTSDLAVSKCKLDWSIHGKIEDYPEKYSNVLTAHSKIAGVKNVNRRMELDLNLSNKPILLDAKEKYTILIIKKYNEKYFHASHETVLNKLRQKFCIVGLRHALKSIVSNFTLCNFLRAKPFQPRMSALPEAHLAYRTKPFTNCEL